MEGFFCPKISNTTMQVIDELLDVHRTQNKPQFLMASEVPLVLYDCNFDGVDWVVDAGMAIT
jgi:tRNA pseudouridine38/39 synthase